MKRFRIVAAGCGGMVNEWIRYSLQRNDTEIVGLVDIAESNALAVRERYQLNCGIYSRIDKAIEETGANLVFDTTIPSAHKEIVTCAIGMNCDVLGEKPMAASLDEAVSMVEDAKSRGKSYAVMQNRRYNTNIRALREMLTSNTIGDIGFVCADFFLGPHFGGFRDVMESPLILDMAIHTFDQARFISGADPVSVYCHEFNPHGSWYGGNASAVCIFEMSNGSVFCYRGSWCAEGVPTAWESSWRIMGSLGTAIWDGSNPPYCEVIPRPLDGKGSSFETIYPKKLWKGREGHYGCLDEMFSALLEGRKAETDCEDNIKSMVMVFGALKSAKEGCKIENLRELSTKQTHVGK